MNDKVVEILEENWECIRDECEKVSGADFTQWPEKSIYQGQWDVYGIYDLQGNLIEPHSKKCPATTQTLRQIPRLRTGGFSMLAPGCHIRPHVGYTDEVLRAHLGLSIPKGNCHLKVGDTLYTWEEGKAFVFDDRILHEAWNKTPHPRYILLVDFYK